MIISHPSETIRENFSLIEGTALMRFIFASLRGLFVETFDVVDSATNHNIVEG